MVYSTENVTGTVGFIQWVNQAATLDGTGILFPGIIMAVFFIMAVRMLAAPENTPGKSIAASAFVAMVLSVFARVLELVSTGYMTIWITATAFCAVWLYIENRN